MIRRIQETHMKKLLAILTLAAFTLPLATPVAAAAGAGQRNRKHKKPKKGKRARQTPNR
jgi:hypothetical protein